MEKESLETAIQLINKDLEISSEEYLPEDSSFSLDELIKFLSKRIDQMLNQEPERLMQAFYRIDLPEEKVKSVLAFTEGLDVSHELAKMVVDRELQKVYFRRKYSQKR